MSFINSYWEEELVASCCKRGSRPRASGDISGWNCDHGNVAWVNTGNPHSCSLFKAVLVRRESGSQLQEEILGQYTFLALQSVVEANRPPIGVFCFVSCEWLGTCDVMLAQTGYLIWIIRHSLFLPKMTSILWHQQDPFFGSFILL